MPASQQSQTPVFKDTSNISRFTTNYAQHSSAKEAGTALSNALGVASSVLASEAKDQKAKDLEEGKQLAMMGVQRENLSEAASGQGVFSGNGGWTQQGFDLQRGAEDAFIRQQDMIKRFNASGLSATDDLGAFRAFVDAEREVMFAELEGASEYYREGYLEGIAPAFQKMGRTWVIEADGFRAGKKRAAMKGRVSSGLLVGDQSEIPSLIDNAPGEHGISHGEGKQVAVEALTDAIREGTITEIAPEVQKKLNKTQKAEVQKAFDERSEREEAEAVAVELEDRREIKRLKQLAVTGDRSAWDRLKAEYPEEHAKLFKVVNNAPTKPKPTASTVSRVDRLVKNLPAWGSENMEDTISDLFEGGQIDQAQYSRLTAENARAAQSRELWKDNSANNFVVTQKAAGLRGDQREAFEGLMDQQIADFIASNHRQPTPAELSGMAGEAAALVRGDV